MSDASTTAMTATPPVMVVSSGLSSISSVIMTPSLMGLPATLGQHEVVLLPPLMPRCPGGVIGPASMPQQQPPSLMLLLAYANYAMGSPQVSFFFRVEPPTILYIICLVSILVSALYIQVPSWMPYSPMGLHHWGLHYCNPLDITHGRHMCNLVMVIGPCLVYIEWLLPSTTLSRESLLLLSQLFSNYPIYMVGHTALAAQQRVTQSLCLPYLMGRGLLFQLQCHQMTQSTLNL